MKTVIVALRQRISELEGSRRNNQAQAETFKRALDAAVEFDRVAAGNVRESYAALELIDPDGAIRAEVDAEFAASPDGREIETARDAMGG